MTTDGQPDYKAMGGIEAMANQVQNVGTNLLEWVLHLPSILSGSTGTDTHYRDIRLYRLATTKRALNLRSNIII